MYKNLNGIVKSDFDWTKDTGQRFVHYERLEIFTDTFILSYTYIKIFMSNI